MRRYVDGKHQLSLAAKVGNGHAAETKKGFRLDGNREAVVRQSQPSLRWSRTA